MLLRKRQKEFVDKSVAALEANDNTLGVAPTGAGKTICLSAVIRELIKGNPKLKVCVLAHRDELTYQNEDKFKLVNPGISTSILNSRSKSWDGQVTFAMVQTLSRKQNLQGMPKIDLLVVDEAHHITAESYGNILNQAAKLNPSLKLYGVTATPVRGDKSSLGKYFTNCADQIKLSELLLDGNLVRPKTWIIETGDIQEKLKALRARSTGDFNNDEMAEILDAELLNSEVVRHWQERAGDRQTVVFCSNSKHAKNVAQAFREIGISTGLISCDTPYAEREATLEALKRSEIQVIVNVAVLTEGWDYPPISCVVLLRSSSYKATMIQMIGRGLRTIDPAIYPDIIKRDCIVLDFGISSIIHGSLEQAIDLNSKSEGFKLCPCCKKNISKAATDCPLCSADLTQEREKSDNIIPINSKRILENFTMAEIDLLERSNFGWTDLKKDSGAIIASGFNSWCCVYEKDDIWYATGGGQDRDNAPAIQTKIVYQGERLEAIAAANDFLYQFEDEETAQKTNHWRTLPPTDSQKNWLPTEFRNEELTRGDASTLLSYSFTAKSKLKEMGVAL